MPEANASQEKNRRLRAAYLADLRATFGSDCGKRTLDQLRARAGLDRPRFLPSAGPGPLDPIAAAIRDGRCSIIQEILADLAQPEDAGDSGPAAIR